MRKNPFAYKVGRNIAKLRNDHGWNQEKLAERTDVAETTVQRWECGHWVPNGFDVCKLAVVFEVSTEAIFAGLPRSIDELQSLHPRKCAEHSVLS